MAARNGLRIILGAANVGDTSIDKLAKYDPPEEVKAFLDTFYKRGGRHLDTARSYSPHAPGSSEPRLGAVEAGKRFGIDSKVVSYGEKPHTREKIEQSVNDQLSALKIQQLDVDFLHMPDRNTSFEETAEAMDKAYREGKFKRFGLSNYTAEEVEKIVTICEKRGFVKPSVYQGQYNPVVRGGEKDLFPVLRKHNMALYAWSPAAAGFFTGNWKEPKEGTRFDTSMYLGQIYSSGYCKPTVEAAEESVRKLAESHSIPGHAAALRWTVYHSTLDPKFGDAVIIGASSIGQLENNLDIIEQGPLPKEVADAFSKIFPEIEKDAFSYHF